MVKSTSTFWLFLRELQKIESLLYPLFICNTHINNIKMANRQRETYRDRVKLAIDRMIDRHWDDEWDAVFDKDYPFLSRFEATRMTNAEMHQQFMQDIKTWGIYELIVLKHNGNLANMKEDLDDLWKEIRERIIFGDEYD